MTENKLQEPAIGSALRGGFVKWPAPGEVMSGVVTYINLEEGSTDLQGNKHGLLQVYDPTVGDQGDGDHGFTGGSTWPKRLCWQRLTIVSGAG